MRKSRGRQLIARCGAILALCRNCKPACLAGSQVAKQIHTPEQEFFILILLRSPGRFFYNMGETEDTIAYEDAEYEGLEPAYETGDLDAPADLNPEMLYEQETYPAGTETLTEEAPPDPLLAGPENQEEEKFIFASLEEVAQFYSAGSQSAEWQKVSASQGGDVLKRGETQEWVYKTEDGNEFSITHALSGTDIEQRHEQILNDLYSQGFSVSEFQKPGGEIAVREIYFADEKGNISYEIHEHRDHSEEEIPSSDGKLFAADNASGDEKPDAAEKTPAAEHAPVILDLDGEISVLAGSPEATATEPNEQQPTIFDFKEYFSDQSSSFTVQSRPRNGTEFSSSAAVEASEAIKYTENENLPAEDALTADLEAFGIAIIEPGGQGDEMAIENRATPLPSHAQTERTAEAYPPKETETGVIQIAQASLDRQTANAASETGFLDAREELRSTEPPAGKLSGSKTGEMAGQGISFRTELQESAFRHQSHKNLRPIRQPGTFPASPRQTAPLLEIPSSQARPETESRPEQLVEVVVPVLQATIPDSQGTSRLPHMSRLTTDRTNHSEQVIPQEIAGPSGNGESIISTANIEAVKTYETAIGLADINVPGENRARPESAILKKAPDKPVTWAREQNTRALYNKSFSSRAGEKETALERDGQDAKPAAVTADSRAGIGTASQVSKIFAAESSAVVQNQFRQTNEKPEAILSAHEQQAQQAKAIKIEAQIPQAANFETPVTKPAVEKPGTQETPFSVKNNTAPKLRAQPKEINISKSSAPTPAASGRVRLAPREVVHFGNRQSQTQKTSRISPRPGATPAPARSPEAAKARLQASPWAPTAVELETEETQDRPLNLNVGNARLAA